MPGLASIFRRPLFRRSQLLGQSGSAAVLPDSQSPGADRRRDEAPAAGHSDRTEAERLERIAAYARVGYFNLSYTYDMFHLAGELPPPE
jgi:hypothetical protein